MYQNKEFFEEMLAFYEKQLQKANKAFEACPNGRIAQVKRNGKQTFFQVDNVNGKRIRKSINKDVCKLSLLVQKEYLKEECKILENDVIALKKFLDKYEEPFYYNIVKKLPERIANLPKEYLFMAFQKSDWQAQPYKQSTYMPEKKIHTTSHGLKVRSKSELLIAEKLYEHDIPFRYEQILTIKGTEFPPDFTIRTDDDKIIYWEHCGLTNNKKYMSHHKWKMDIYEEAGIVPWKNLIVTYDSENGMLDLGIIESEIVNKVKA